MGTHKRSGSSPASPPCYAGPPNSHCIRLPVCRKLNQDCAAFRQYLKDNDGDSPQALETRGLEICDIKELKDAPYDDSPIDF